MGDGNAITTDNSDNCVEGENSCDYESGNEDNGGNSSLDNGSSDHSEVIVEASTSASRTCGADDTPTSPSAASVGRQRDTREPSLSSPLGRIERSRSESRRRRCNLYNFMLTYAFTLDREHSITLAAEEVDLFLGRACQLPRVKPGKIFFLHSSQAARNRPVCEWLSCVDLPFSENRAIRRIGQWVNGTLAAQRSRLLDGLCRANALLAIENERNEGRNKPCFVVLTSETYRKTDMYLLCFLHANLAGLLSDLNRHRDEPDRIYIRSSLFAPSLHREKDLALHADAVTRSLSPLRLSKFFYKLSERHLADIDKRGSDFIVMCQRSRVSRHLSFSVPDIGRL